ncbi:DUF4347 domain-containing protein [Phormidium tenue FACHB-886]|nr:DUF4347 domain-containing protein [Phormidium tenue FACHB-886]
MLASTATLIFVDSSVEDYQFLIQGANAAEAILLDSNQDGVQQITQVLASRRGIGSVQIVSHGTAGRLQIGSSDLDADNLDHYAPQLRQWKKSFTPTANLLLLGCKVAMGEAGKAFVRRISQLTRATVAASETLTGSAAKGGNWALEFVTGEVSSAIALHPQTLSAYTGVLENFNVSNYEQLRGAITTATVTPGDDVINLTGNIDLTGELPIISSNITFVGNSATVNGVNAFRVFRVDGGIVNFLNLTIANGRAAGTPGTDGGNQAGGVGGVGQGGGLLVNGGAVTIVNSNFSNNQAVGGDGGNSVTSLGGNGGDGLGGAVYVNAGSLRISTTTFNGNAAIAGQGGRGLSNGTRGNGKGGAISVNTGATVVSERTPVFNLNTATNPAGTDTDNINLFGAVTVVIPPTVSSIGTAQPNPTADPTVNYVVTFDQAVTGVDVTDFRLASTGNIVGAAIVSVTPAATAASQTYTVAVNTGTGNGSLRLDLADNDSINSGGIPLGSTGIGNGDRVGAAYTVDKTPPSVFAISLLNPNPTAADALTYRVFFNQNVSGVDATDFALAASTGSTISGASVTSVNAFNPFTYDVTVNSGTGNGGLGLNLIDDDSIRNALGVQLGGVGVGNGNSVGQSYTIDKTPPAVVTIAPADANPTKADTVAYTVSFGNATTNQPVSVTGVDATDFALAPVNVTGANILSVTPVAGDNSRYTVLVNTGTGDGSLGLNLVDNDTIQNGLGVSLGGRGATNGNFTGQTYTLLKSNPIVTAIAPINPNPTASPSINYAVTFSQDVAGVDVTDFSLAPSGIAGAGITAVSGSGRSYTVTASTGTGSGALGLNLVDNDSIVNSVATPLGGAGNNNGSFTGQAYTINKQPPRIASISRLETNPTNAATVNFAVTFNENVIQVDTADFALAVQGVSGAQISSVTRVNSSFYTVAVSTGNGDGAIGLNLANNASILNTLGVPLSSGFAGEVYNIDKSAPAVDIVDVAPDPRRDRVDSVTLRFNEAVSGFNLSDLRLTRGDTPISLSTASLSSTDGINWRLGNLRKLTNQRGDYTLTLVAGESGIRDAAGNALAANAVDRWTNLVTVNACLPGITRRGTRQADTLQGTDDNDTLQGLEGNDTLIGLDCQDRLVGDGGNDRLDGGSGNDFLRGSGGNDALIGGTGTDTLNGGQGADRFIYAGSTQAEALAQSLTAAPDRVQGFRFSQGDKFQLVDRPRGLFNAGDVNGGNLAGAARSAYADKDQRRSGSQALQGNEAVFFNWRGQTYLSVNNSSRSFSAAEDLVADVRGIGLRSGDSTAGVLTVNSYFA